MQFRWYEAPSYLRPQLVIIMKIGNARFHHHTLQGAASPTHRDAPFTPFPSTTLTSSVIPAQAGIQGRGVDSRFRGSDGGEAVPSSSSYVARRCMGNYYYENSQPPTRHSCGSRNPGSRDIGSRAKSPTPPPLDSGLRRNDEVEGCPSLSFRGSGLSQCHSERAERVEESKVPDFGIAGKSPTPTRLDSGAGRNGGKIEKGLKQSALFPLVQLALFDVVP